MQLNKLMVSIILMGIFSTAHANQIAITNTSTTHKPMIVVYQVAHKNEGKNVVLSSPETVTVTEAIMLPVDLAGYDYAGIVPVSVDGHNIPSSDTRFDTPQQCSVTTDKTHVAGVMELDSKSSPDGHHGTASCTIKGGVFN